MKKFWIFKVIIIAAVAIFGFGFAVMWLWNSLIPDLFHGPVINFPQAIGLLILSKILLKGFGFKRNHWRHQQWRERMQQKMDAMTPDEREKFREQWRKRCGKFGRWNESGIGSNQPQTSE